jgi:hypothetical protein
MRRLLVDAATGGREVLPAVEERALLARRSGPIDYVYVDLPEGVHVMLPGMAALPPGYDVRTAGFYQISDHQRGARWGSPYIDSTTDARGDDLVLPCTAGLWSPAGDFLGVAGVEITVTKLVETALALPDVPTLRASLLDGRGRKVIDSTDAGRRFAASGKDEGLILRDFDIPEVVAAVKAGGGGVRVLQRGGREVLVAWAPLDAVGWFYVVEIDAQAIMR